VTAPKSLSGSGLWRRGKALVCFGGRNSCGKGRIDGGSQRLYFEVERRAMGKWVGVGALARGQENEGGPGEQTHHEARGAA
jgi:hypothetical protein